MREFLADVWNAPKAEFLALVPVLLDNLLYVVFMTIALLWLWRKANAPHKEKK
jgi:hypothetical protein